MKRVRVPVKILVAGCLVLLVGASVLRTVAAERRLYRPAGDAGVRRADRTLNDASRNRDIPVRIYRPAGAPKAGKLPAVVFSPGLGASRSDYGYLGEALASAGYVVVVLTHPGNEAADWRRWLRETPRNSEERRRGWILSTIEDPVNLKNRPLDVSFVIDRLVAGELGDDVDPGRIGVGGHSFGASTAMAVGGMLVDLPGAEGTSFRDGRVKAVFAMSPQGPGTMGISEDAWDGVKVPVLLMTGTRDSAPGERTVEWRKTAMTRMHDVDRYAITLLGGTHLTFGGRGEISQVDEPRAATGPRDLLSKLSERLPKGIRSRAHHVTVIKATVTAFLDGYAGGSDRAVEWMRSYAGAPHPDVEVEFLPA